MGLIGTKFSVSKFLYRKKSKAESSKQAYLSHLKSYFEFFYPQLKPLRGKKALPLLDKLSIQYLSEDRNWDEDLDQYYDYIVDFSPKSVKKHELGLG